MRPLDEQDRVLTPVCDRTAKMLWNASVSIVDGEPWRLPTRL